MAMDFLKKFYKEVEELEGISTNAEPPRYWYSTGSVAVNRVLSGSLRRGIPQGRITLFCGPSGAGKSFLVGNAVTQAQKEGAHILVIDSENALDSSYMSAIGCDVNNNYTYISVITIAQAQNVISQFIKGYRSEYGNDITAPKILICIDSISMLLTDSEWENYEKGITKGDQGQRNKTVKGFLRGLTQDIKSLNVSVVATAQTYKNQDLMNGEGVHVLADAIRYSASLIGLLTKLKLKGEKIEAPLGIRMKCEGIKSRFCVPFQQSTVEVPFSTGMDQYSGLASIAIELGVIEKKGSRYCIIGDEKTWFEKDIAEYAEEIIEKCEALSDRFVMVAIGDNEVEILDDSSPSISSKRKQKVVGK